MCPDICIFIGIYIYIHIYSDICIYPYTFRYMHISIYIQRALEKAESVLISVNNEQEELRRKLKIYEEKDGEIESLKKDYQCLELELKRVEEEKEQLRTRLQVHEERNGEDKAEIESIRLINIKLEKNCREFELGMRRAESGLINMTEDGEELNMRLKVHEENYIGIGNLKVVNLKLEKNYNCLELELKRVEEEKEQLRMRLHVHEERDGEGNKVIESMKVTNMKLEKEYNILELRMKKAEFGNEEIEELRMSLHVHEERAREWKEEITSMKVINMTLEKQRESDDDLINYEQLKWCPMHLKEVRDLISNFKGMRFLYVLYV